MSENAQQQFILFSSKNDDEYDEDIDNYDNELFNVYDDGIVQYAGDQADDTEADAVDDDLMEDNDPTLPLFSDLDEEEFDPFDELED